MENHGRTRKGAGEIDQFGQLRFQQPRIERQIEFAQLRVAFAEVFLCEQSGPDTR
jgi:hypothetical protein